MTNAEILKFLVDRFANKCEMYIFFRPDKSDEQSTVHVLFPCDISLCFCFMGYLDSVDIRCVFKVNTFKDDSQIDEIKMLVEEFNEGHQDDILPFKKLDYSMNKDNENGEIYSTIYLSSTITRNDLNNEVISEYVGLILHPTPFMRKIIELSRK